LPIIAIIGVDHPVSGYLGEGDDAVKKGLPGAPIDIESRDGRISGRTQRFMELIEFDGTSLQGGLMGSSGHRRVLGRGKCCQDVVGTEAFMTSAFVDSTCTSRSREA